MEGNNHYGVRTHYPVFMEMGHLHIPPGIFSGAGVAGARHKAGAALSFFCSARTGSFSLHSRHVF